MLANAETSSTHQRSLFPFIPCQIFLNISKSLNYGKNWTGNWQLNIINNTCTTHITSQESQGHR